MQLVCNISQAFTTHTFPLRAAWGPARTSRGRRGALVTPLPGQHNGAVKLLHNLQGVTELPQGFVHFTDF